MKNITVTLDEDEYQSIALIAENEHLALKEAALAMIQLGLEIFVQEDRAYQETEKLLEE